MIENYETHEHDVLVIGAGGAGLRAAIAASAAGASVGVVCKSLLGKAHTVMAEGGMAASLGNVDPDDNWKVHFADTMRGGQMINNWRMAEIFAKEAPDRVYELERWGRSSTERRDGKIMQRPFGAHSWRRLCHVGDRTGLELIRTLQDKAVHSGLDIYMECTLTRLSRTVIALRCIRVLARGRSIRPFSCQGDRHRHRRLGANVQSHLQLMGRHGRRRGDGVRGRCRTARYGNGPVSPYRHGVASGRARTFW